MQSSARSQLKRLQHGRGEGGHGVLHGYNSQGNQK